MAKFSEVVKSEVESQSAVASARAALNSVMTAGAASKAAVTSALHAKGKSVALVQADGSVNVYSLNADGTDYDVVTVPGDFDV